MYIVLSAVKIHLLFVMRREVVQDQVYPLLWRIPFSQELQDAQAFLPAFPFPHISPQIVGMDVVKGQPVANAVCAMVCGRQPFGMVAVTITSPVLRTYLQRPELVECHRRPILRKVADVLANQFFLDLRRGSLHSFHVFVRRSLTFFSLRMVRRVSIEMLPTMRSSMI